MELFLWKSFVSSHNCVQWGYMIIRVCQICEIVYLFSILILISLLYLFMISLCYGWHYKLNCDVAILKKTKRLGLMHENISMNSESDTFHMIWIQTMTQYPKIDYFQFKANDFSTIKKSISLFQNFNKVFKIQCYIFYHLISGKLWISPGCQKTKQRTM